MKQREKLPDIDITKVKKLNEGCDTKFNLFGVMHSIWCWLCKEMTPKQVILMYISWIVSFLLLYVFG